MFWVDCKLTINGCQQAIMEPRCLFWLRDSCLVLTVVSHMHPAWSLNCAHTFTETTWLYRWSLSNSFLKKQQQKKNMQNANLQPWSAFWSVPVHLWYFKEKHSLISISYPNNIHARSIQGSEMRLSKYRKDLSYRECDAWDKTSQHLEETWLWGITALSQPCSFQSQWFHQTLKMTGTCVQWWTCLRLVKCKNCLQVKIAPVFNKQLHSMAPQRLV